MLVDVLLFYLKLSFFVVVKVVCVGSRNELKWFRICGLLVDCVVSFFIVV